MIAVPKDSRISLEWLQNACAQNPVQKILDRNTGQFTGNFTTGPVRLAWTKNLFTPQKSDDGKDRWSVTALFPPGVDVSPLVVAGNEAAAAGFPQNMTAQGFNWQGLHSPWSDQAAKAAQYKGYTPGAWCFNAGTYFKPRIVDPNMNDILDPARVYAGVWAILAVNPYVFGNVPRQGRPTKKGVNFGLQSTVIISDDDVLGGGGVDPRAAFAGINIQSNVNIAAAFGQGAGPPLMPPVTAPGGTQPAAPAPSGPVSLEQMRALGLI